MTQNPGVSPSRHTISTGVPGLDQVLFGGFPAHRLYLLEGAPGTGKTTLALQFLLAGRERGKRSLYMTLSETKDELGDVAESHGWSLQGVDSQPLEAKVQQSSNHLTR
jgi:circadian clock protein KaiC